MRTSLSHDESVRIRFAAVKGVAKLTSCLKASRAVQNTSGLYRCKFGGWRISKRACRHDPTVTWLNIESFYKILEVAEVIDGSRGDECRM